MIRSVYSTDRSWSVIEERRDIRASVLFKDHHKIRESFSRTFEPSEHAYQTKEEFGECRIQFFSLQFYYGASNRYATKTKSLI